MCIADLAYITDRVIVMGYPAEGLEGFYRNRREDAKKFLEHRHGKDFWVFNFCPVKENSYPADVFDGRVSRYPFPDHQYVFPTSASSTFNPGRGMLRLNSQCTPTGRFASCCKGDETLVAGLE